MSHEIHYCECGEEIIDDMEMCGACERASKTERGAGSELGGAAGSAAIVAAIEALNRHIEKGLTSFESQAARYDRAKLVDRLIEITQPPNDGSELRRE